MLSSCNKLLLDISTEDYIFYIRVNKCRKQNIFVYIINLLLYLISSLFVNKRFFRKNFSFFVVSKIVLILFS